MNVLMLRDLANAAAQDAHKRLMDHYIATHEWDRHLSAEYHVAEELVTLADERLREVADLDDGPEPLALTPDPGDHFRQPAH